MRGVARKGDGWEVRRRVAKMGDVQYVKYGDGLLGGRWMDGYRTETNG